MMEMFRITGENMSAFHPLIREDAYPFLLDADHFALGIAEDNTAIAAAVFRLDGGREAELVSICVDVDHRRQGLGTELISDAADYLTEWTDVNRFVCAYEDTGHEEAFIGFLKEMGFTINEAVGACYSTTLGELIQIPVLAGAGKSVIPYSKLTERQKKQLQKEELDLLALMENGAIDENLSCVKMEKNKIACCLVFVKEDDGSLTLEWARGNMEDAADLLILFRHVAAAAAGYPPETSLYIPVLNGQSKKLVLKLLDGRCQKTEQAYTAELELFE